VHYSNSLSVYSRNMAGVFVFNQPFLVAPINSYIERMTKAGSDWVLQDCDSYQSGQDWIESKLNKSIHEDD